MHNAFCVILDILCLLNVCALQTKIFLVFPDVLFYQVHVFSNRLEKFYAFYARRVGDASFL